MFRISEDLILNSPGLFVTLGRPGGSRLIVLHDQDNSSVARWRPRPGVELRHVALSEGRRRDHQGEERQRRREAATWTHRACQASVTVKSVLAPGSGRRTSTPMMLDESEEGAGEEDGD